MNKDRVKNMLNEAGDGGVVEVIHITFEPGKRCLFFHRWSKWASWDGSPFIQIRKCSRCDLLQFTRTQGV